MGSGFRRKGIRNRKGFWNGLAAFLFAAAALWADDARAQSAPEADAPAAQMIVVSVEVFTATPEPGWFVSGWSGACGEGGASVQVGTPDKLGQSRTCRLPGAGPVATVGVVFNTCNFPITVSADKSACECGGRFSGPLDNCRLRDSECAFNAVVNQAGTECECKEPNTGGPDNCKLPASECVKQAELNEDETACVCNSPPNEGTPDNCVVANLACAAPAEVNDEGDGCACKSPNAGTPDDCLTPPSPSCMNLFTAAQSDDSYCARYWVAAGHDVDDNGGSFGSTPLHNAAANEATLIVKLLIDSGANVNAEDSLNDTPLDWTHTYNATEAMRILVANGGCCNNRCSSPSCESIVQGAQDAESPPLRFAARECLAGG